MRPPVGPTVYLRGRRLKPHLPTIADEEGKRLNAQHWLLEMVAGRRHFAPVKNPRAILDVACGTGIWGYREAQHFRQATVYNLDLHQAMTERWLRVFTAKQPSLRHRLKSYEADALLPLPFEDHTFDFVHGRFMAVFIPRARWPQVIAELVRVTKPGGSIEVVDGEYPQLENAPHFTLIREGFMRFLDLLALHQDPTSQVAACLKQAGAEEINSCLIQVGTRLNHRRKLVENFAAAAQALHVPMLATTALAPGEFATALVRFREEMLDHEMSWTVRAIWGKKPTASSRGEGEP